MGADARMAGRERKLCHCKVPGHGMGCSVAREQDEAEKGRSRERREYEGTLAFEDRQYMGWEEPGNDGVDRSPEKSERLTEFMEKYGDESSFDEDGVVR